MAEQSFTEQEKAKMELKQVQLANEVIRDFHVKNNMSMILLNSNGLVNWSGNLYEIEFLLRTFLEEFQANNKQLLAKKLDKLSKEAQAQQKADADAKATEEEAPKVEVVDDKAAQIKEQYQKELEK